MKRIKLFLIMLACTCKAFCQLDMDILNFYAKVPQEKLFIHTDKDYYTPGDTIWLRVHMADAVTNKPVCRSKYVYVELLDNTDNSLIKRIKIKADQDSVFSNMMTLDKHLSIGNYTLYAYTQWMTNFSSDTFFNKQIHLVERYTSNKNNHTTTRQRHLSLTIFPEGGNLVAGKLQRVAYKVIDEHHHGIDVIVRLKNHHGEILQENKSQYLGMGYIVVNATSKDSLILEATDSYSNTCSAFLPTALDYGATLHITQHKNTIVIEVVSTSNFDITKHSILLYGAGNLLTFDMKGLKTNIVRIRKSLLSPGVVNVALLENDKRHVVSERRIFIFDRKHSGSNASKEMESEQNTK